MTVEVGEQFDGPEQVSRKSLGLGHCRIPT